MLYICMFYSLCSCFAVTLMFYGLSLYSAVYRGVNLILLRDLASSWHLYLLIMFWISIILCKIVLAWMIPVQELIEDMLVYRFGKWKGICLRVVFLAASIICPYHPLLTSLQKWHVGARIRQSDMELAMLLDCETPLSENAWRSVMKIHEEGRELVKKKLDWNRRMVPQILENIIQFEVIPFMSVAFIGGTPIGPLEFCGAVFFCTLQRFKRCLNKKEDPSGVESQLWLLLWKFVETGPRLACFFLMLNYCGASVDNLSPYSSNYSLILLLVLFGNFVTAVLFNVETPLLRILKISDRYKGIGLGWAILKAINCLFFPCLGRNWEEPQGRHGTDELRNTKNDVNKDWIRNLYEYKVKALFYVVENILLILPTVDCSCRTNLKYAMYAFAIFGCLFMTGLQIWLYKVYNERHNPCSRLLKFIILLVEESEGQEIIDSQNNRPRIPASGAS